MNTEKERADFEAWWATRKPAASIKDDAFAAYQAGRAALQSQPNTGELPHQSREAVLRAMSRNYTPGKHTWDSLDSDACAKGADEIRQLRAALALQSQYEIQFQVWRSTDSCMEFWSWDEADQYDYDQAKPENRRIIQIVKEG